MINFKFCGPSFPIHKIKWEITRKIQSAICSYFFLREKSFFQGQELADIQKRKEEALARQKAEEERRKAEEAAAGKESENPEDAADTHDAPKKAEENDYTRVVSEPVMRIDFRVWGTKEQILALRDYMKQNNLKFGKVE